MRLFLDCDGVLADFDRGFEKLIGMHPRKFEPMYGSKVFWERVREVRLFANLPVMPDAIELFDGVKHLGPTIITGCPLGGWAEAQKAEWLQKRFPDVPAIMCMSEVKYTHGKRGDVLIDDWAKYRHLWEGMGGIFIHHKTALQSLLELSVILKENEHDGIHIV